jgi:CheY-like chemotaxis protein
MSREQRLLGVMRGSRARKRRRPARARRPPFGKGSDVALDAAVDPPTLENKTDACRSILLVEDDPDIQESLKDALEWEGYHVVGASNGREALDRLPGMPRPCLILLDLMMPVMNGWEFAQAVQTDVMLAAIPIVVVSAFTDEAETKKIRTREVVKKPVDLDLLLRVVKRYCGC